MAVLISLTYSFQFYRGKTDNILSVCLCLSVHVSVCVQELGVTDNPNYNITFMLDSAAMITVHTPKRGVVEVGTHRAVHK